MQLIISRTEINLNFLNFFKKHSGAVSTQVKASTAYTICSVLQRCLSFITLPVFARILSIDEYGMATIYSSTMAILIIFTSLQLPFGSFDTAMMKYEDDRKGYMSSVNGLCTLLTLIYFIIYIPFRGLWNDLLDLPTILMLVMGVEMLMSTAINFWTAKARFEYEYKKVVFLTLFQSMATTGLSIFAVLIAHENKGLIKVLAFSAVVIAIGTLVYVKSIVEGKKFYNKEYWKYALSFNIPLVPYYVSQMIFNQSDRLMINKICGRSDAAKYGVAYTLAIILNFILTAINGSYTPWLYRQIKERKFEANKKVSLAIAVLMAFLLLGVIALAPEIIFILAGAKYAEAIWVVPPVAMSLIFLFYTQLFANIEFYFEEKYYLAAGSILSAVTNIVLNAWLIPIYGYVAAGYTTLFSFMLFALCNYWCMVKVCKKREMDYHIYDLKALIILALVFMGLGFILTCLYSYILARLVLVGIVLLTMIVFHKQIIQLVKRYLAYFS